jgi:ABC-2 family transporter
MVPALLVQLTLFGTAFVGFALIAEYRSGVIERMRVTPVSRAALLLGRSLRDVMVLTIQGALLIALAVPFGLPAADVAGASLAVHRVEVQPVRLRRGRHPRGVHREPRQHDSADRRRSRGGTIDPGPATRHSARNAATSIWLALRLPDGDQSSWCAA